jgi:hypothetical protein
MSSSADEFLEVPAEINAALEVLRENRFRLEKLMSTKLQFESKHTKAAAELAAATKTLSTEARLWSEQLQTRAARSTAEQRTAACLAHLTRLPQGLWLTAYRELCAKEAKAPQPIKLLIKEPPAAK